MEKDASTDSIRTASLVVIVCVVVIVVCGVVTCVGIYLHTVRPRLSHSQRVALPNSSFDIRDDAEHGLRETPPPSPTAVITPSSSARPLPNRTSVRTVPVFEAKEDALQIWRFINTSDLAGDALRQVSAAPSSSLTTPLTSPRRTRTDSARHPRRQRRGGGARMSHRLARAERADETTTFSRTRGHCHEDSATGEGAETRADADGHVAEQCAVSGCSTPQPLDFLGDVTPDAREDANSDLMSTCSTSAASASTASTYRLHESPSVWCALGIPQHSPVLSSLPAPQYAREAMSVESEMMTAEDPVGANTTDGAPHRLLAPSQQTDGHDAHALTMPQESMPWHPYRLNRKFLLLFPDGRTERTTDVEPWEVQLARHRQRELQTQQSLSQASATTTVPVQSDVSDTPSQGRSPLSLIERLFSRQSRHQNAARSVSPAGTPAAVSPPFLSPVETSALAPPHAPFSSAAAAQAEVSRGEEQQPAADSMSPTNVVAPALVLVLGPPPPPPSPTRTAFLPPAEHVYGRGSVYERSPEPVQW